MKNRLLTDLKTDKPSLASLLRAFFQVSVAGLLFLTLFCFLDSFFWAADLFTNLRLYYAALSLVLLALTLLLGSYRWAGVALAMLLLNLAATFFCLLPDGPSPRPGSKPLLKVLSLNVLTGNRESQRVVDYVREADPDVVAFLEVDDFWSNHLSVLLPTWPYMIAENRPDNFGIRIMSKYPFSYQEFIRDNNTDCPAVLVRLQSPIAVTLVATHPLTPVNPYSWRLRDEHLQQVALRLNQETQPVILLGDLNATPWSKGYRRFAKASGLSGFMSERGLWPTHQTRIPIDYVMAKGLALQNFRIGPDVGSDHRGISAEVFFQSPLKQSKRRETP